MCSPQFNAAVLELYWLYPVAQAVIKNAESGDYHLMIAARLLAKGRGHANHPAALSEI
jgi:hypothetical protein